MGTSVSQASPKVTNWNRVLVCYSDENIPEDRIINEIWRASENEESPISEAIKSEAVFSCYKAVESSENFREALEKVIDHVIQNSGNSIVVEFAKRAIPAAFQSTSPSQEWKSLFFSELTNYVISRDASGFVCPNNRNKSVSQLIDYKKRITEKVRKIIGPEKAEPKSLKDWYSLVEESINKLKSFSE